MHFYLHYAWNFIFVKRLKPVRFIYYCSSAKQWNVEYILDKKKNQCLPHHLQTNAVRDFFKIVGDHPGTWVDYIDAVIFGVRTKKKKKKEEADDHQVLTLAGRLVNHPNFPNSIRLLFLSFCLWQTTRQSNTMHLNKNSSFLQNYFNACYSTTITTPTQGMFWWIEKLSPCTLNTIRDTDVSFYILLSEICFVISKLEISDWRQKCMEKMSQNIAKPKQLLHRKRQKSE